jgi:hypothetical protein
MGPTNVYGFHLPVKVYTYILSVCFYADPPTVKVQLESNIDLDTVKEGDVVLLFCEVRANPQPEPNAVTWYHGVSSNCSSRVSITFFPLTVLMCARVWLKSNRSVWNYVVTPSTDSSACRKSTPHFNVRVTFLIIFLYYKKALPGVSRKKNMTPWLSIPFIFYNYLYCT